jgi:hypothetical protein
VSISWTDVVAIGPELVNVPTATQTAILAIVARQVDPCVWGDLANDGMAYLAAHLASIRGNSGLVTSESLGQMSRSYSLPPGIKGSFALSTYGAEYYRLLRIATCVAVLVP